MSIHAFVKSNGKMGQVPLAFIIMSRRQTRDYVAVFRKVRELLDSPAVEEFCIDFEKGTHIRDPFTVK